MGGRLGTGSGGMGGDGILCGGSVGIDSLGRRGSLFYYPSVCYLFRARERLLYVGVGWGLAGVLERGLGGRFCYRSNVGNVFIHIGVGGVCEAFG